MGDIYIIVISSLHIIVSTGADLAKSEILTNGMFLKEIINIELKS